MDTTHSFTCQHCGQPGEATQAHAKYCSKTCKDGARYLRQKASGVAQARARRKIERGYFKTPEKRAAVSEYVKTKRAEGAPFVKDNNNRLRARKYGVEYESINHLEIFDRDGWVCQLCLEPVDPKLPARNPMCATLDHVIPMEEGGPHLKTNVQLAHLTCNSKKSNQKDQQALRR
jgi:5-methylcytosine-specific restriction endonuclease McrA